MRAGLRAFVRERPEWWLVAATAAAWLALIALSAQEWIDSGDQPAHGQAGHDHARHHGGAAPFWVAMAWWAAMVVAMMLPLVLRHARWLAFRTLRRQRQRALVVFATGYLSVWLAAGAVAITASAPVRGESGAVAVALLAAAGWHCAPVRRRLLRRCGATRAPAVAGKRAPRDWFETGIRAGGRCVGSCWALMLAMAVVHHPALMLGATLVIASERRSGPNPERRAGRVADACWLAGAGVLAVLLAAA